MGNFILAVFIPLGSPDPVGFLEQAMRPYAGEGNKTGGWVVLEWHVSTDAVVTSDAYIALDATWHERQRRRYPEERARTRLLAAISRTHLAQYGRTELHLLQQIRDAVPPAVTAWHQEWESTRLAVPCLVACVWCHA
jgi:hypothetical protein